MPIYKLTIKLTRPRKTYYQGEILDGVIIIENKYDLRHDGISLHLKGAVEINFNFRSIKFMDTFHGSNKSIVIADWSSELDKPGKLLPGVTKIPFQIPIGGHLDRSTLYETYHGVFITIQRPLLFKDIQEVAEFFIEYDANPIGAPQLIRQPLNFEITPESLSASRRDIIPNFKISGQIDNSICLLNEPITGERDYSRDATEVQNIQIGDGNLLRNIPVNIHMVLPRLFTCPTLITSYFKVEFEVNLVVIFEDSYLITENFPIKLIRSMLQPIDHL